MSWYFEIVQLTIWRPLWHGTEHFIPHAIYNGGVFGDNVWFGRIHCSQTFVCIYFLVSHAAEYTTIFEFV
jgi:hypothetical protein